MSDLLRKSAQSLRQEVIACDQLTSRRHATICNIVLELQTRQRRLRCSGIRTRSTTNWKHVVDAREKTDAMFKASSARKAAASQAQWCHPDPKSIQALRYVFDWPTRFDSNATRHS